MLRNISYGRKDVLLEIDSKVGKAFSFFDKIKMGGNGSQRFEIIEASESIDRLNKYDNKTNYCNLEIRRSGLIMGFHARLETYAWAVSFDLITVSPEASWTTHPSGMSSAGELSVSIP